MNFRVEVRKGGRVSYHSASGTETEVSAAFEKHGYEVVSMTSTGETDKSARYTKGADERTIGEVEAEGTK